MSWNYRVIRIPDDPVEGSTCYVIHEVKYSKRGKIEGWSERPMMPLGCTLKELRNDLRYMQRALKAPILEVKNGKLAKVKK